MSIHCLPWCPFTDWHGAHLLHGSVGVCSGAVVVGRQSVSMSCSGGVVCVHTWSNHGVSVLCV